MLRATIKRNRRQIWQFATISSAWSKLERMEQAMTNLKIVGAAVIAASALSSPALAQAIISNPAACESEFASANCQNMGARSPYSPRSTGYYHRRTAYRQPAAVAAGVAGAAVGTAAAVATAPFAWGNSYAMYGQPAMYGMYGENGWYGDWNSYATRNGIVCRPGTYFKGDDGRQHLCQ
jgi:hypothetical protein